MPGAADAWCEVRGADLVLRIRIQPRSSRDAIEGVHGGRLRVRITAPPVDGAANERLIELLAGALGIARRRLAFARGERARDKDIVLANGAAEHARCLALVPEK